MANGLPAGADGAAGLRELAAHGGGPAMQRRLAELLRTDRPRLIAALYRLDVDEAQARRWLAAANRDATQAAAGLAGLIVRRIGAKLRTTAADRGRGAGRARAADRPPA